MDSLRVNIQMNLLTTPTSYDPKLFINYCWRLDASLEIRIICCFSTNTGMNTTLRQ